MSDSPPPEPTFTPKEVEYMAAAMMCLKEGVPTNAMIDTPRFTKLTNLTEGSATVTWNKLRRKLMAQASGDGTAVVATPKAWKTPGSKRKGGEGAGTPSKKPRVRKEKAKAGVLEDGDRVGADFDRELAVNGGDGADEEVV